MAPNSMWTRNKTAIPLLFLFFYWLIFNYLVFGLTISLFDITDLKAIKQVHFIASSSDAPPLLAKEYWQPISLPDDWYQNQHKVDQIWYRKHVALNIQTAEIWAIYLPSVTHNAAVYINGTWVGQGGRFSDPVSRHQNEPLLFNFSSKLLRPGVNQIDIRVKTAFSEQGLLDEFYIAPKDRLIDAYSWKHYFRVSFIQWITMAMYLIGFVIFIFWLVRPQDSIYGIFSIELFLWATHNLNLFIAEIPVSARVWEAMNINTLGWMVMAMIVFNHRYVGKGNIKVERFMLSFVITGVFIFFLPDIASVLHIGYALWDSFVMAFGIYALYYLIQTYKKQKDFDAYLMMLAGIPILVFGFHDILLINNFIDRRDGMTMQFSIVPSVLLFSWFLIRRLVQSINKVEYLAETLEQRVKEKQHRLKLQYEKLHALEKKQVLTEERERIMRDIHDGIGGQLVTVISLLHSDNKPIFIKIREKVQQSLVDLRFVIDSLDPLLNDLPTLLGIMRMRLVEQLEAVNIKLEWNVTELPEIKNMGPQHSLHIMRIVQEAITNCIKHSTSKKITLATGVIENNKIYIDIIDYGQTSDNNSSNASRGIKNMQYRAKQLDGELLITHTNQGMTVRLLLNI